MQLKAGETGGARPIPRYLCHAAREQEPSVWHMQAHSSVVPKNSFTCETPTPAAMPCQNNSPIMTPGLTTLNFGIVSVVLYLLLSYLSVCSAVAFWQRCAIGCEDVVVLDTSEHAKQGREDTCEQSEAEQHTIMCKPTFSSFTLRQAGCCHDRPCPTSL